MLSERERRREIAREDMMCRYEVNKHNSQKIVVLRKAFKASHTINFSALNQKRFFDAA